MPRPTARPRSSTGRWRWSAPASRCWCSQPDETGPGALAVADEFQGRGAEVWVASAATRDAGKGSSVALPLASAAHPALAPLLTVQSFYRAINALALRRGHNPDLPPHLNKVTETV